MTYRLSSAFGLARFELRRFRRPLQVVALLFVLLIPVLYGAIYLAGNWDPYGRLDRLPVAVVDEDQPVTFDGRELTAGRDFTENLVQAHTFDFRRTALAEAEDGLRDGRYYLVIHVPRDFSRSLVSGSGPTPQRAAIMLHRNDANGFVIGSITNQAQKSIESAVDQTATRAYFKALFDNLATIRTGMRQAADGAARLDTGLGSATAGSTQLSAGAVKARDGSAQLAAGSARLHDGLVQAQAGSTRLADGTARLASGSRRLASGARQVADGTQQLASTVDPLLALAAQKLPGVQAQVKQASARIATLAQDQARVAEQVKAVTALNRADLAALAQQYPELAQDPAYQRLLARAGTIAERTARIDAKVGAVSADLQHANTLVQQSGDLGTRAATAKAKIDALNAGAQQVADGAQSLSSGAAQVDVGAQRLATGLGSAVGGSARLADGSAGLHTGLGALADGSTRLDQGLRTASSGAHELATKLTQGAARLPDMKPDDRVRTADVLSRPTDVSMHVDNPAHVYGRGLAPMFFSIALWVLGISAFMLLRPVNARSLMGRGSNLRVALASWLPMGTVSVVAAWIMLGVSWVGLGLDPVHPWLMIAMVTLVAVCFSVVAHLLRTSAGLVATAALLVLLIVQLTTAGGTYPAEILPPLFRVLHPWSPMSYSIDAFRICISGGLMSRLVTDATVLAVVALAGATTLWFVIGAKRRATLVDLHPLIGD